METFQSGMPDQLREYWLAGPGADKVGWGTDGSFTRCVSYLRDHVDEHAEGTCANLYHEATGRWPGARRKASAALERFGRVVEFRAAPDDLGDLAAMVIDGDLIAIPRSTAAAVLELVGNHPDPVDLTVVTIEDSRFYAAVADNRLARDDMPQIPPGLLDEFRRWADTRGATSWKEQVDPRSLFATQNELDARKVGKMVASIRNEQLDPVEVPLVASSDDRILDGHHRWAAEVALVGEAPRQMSVVRFSAPMSALLRLGREFAGLHGIDPKAHGMSTGTVTFAGCTDAACAPPPAGTGGSLPGGGSGGGGGDYHGGHRPTDTGPRIHDMIEGGIVPTDVYDNPHYYTGYSGRELRETMRQLNAVRGNPDATVTIYRAAPDVDTPIRDGDWVTLSPSYARNHANSAGELDALVVHQMDVPAASVRWAVDDLMEYGWFPDRRDILVDADEFGAERVEFRQFTPATQPRVPAGTSEGGRWMRADGAVPAVTVGEPGAPFVPEALRNPITGQTAEQVIERFNPKRSFRSKRRQLNDLEAAYEAAGTTNNKPRVVSSDEMDKLAAKELPANIVGSNADFDAFVNGATHPPRLGVRGNGTMAFTGNPNRPTLRGVMERNTIIETETEALQALSRARIAASGRGPTPPSSFLTELGSGLGADVMDRMDHSTFAALRGVQAIKSKEFYGGGLDAPYLVLDRGVITTDLSRVRPTTFTPPTRSGLPVQSFVEESRADAARRRETDARARDIAWQQSVDRGLRQIRAQFSASGGLAAVDADWVARHYESLVMAPAATAHEWGAILDELLLGGPHNIDPTLRHLFEQACTAAGIVAYPHDVPDGTRDPM